MLKLNTKKAIENMHAHINKYMTDEDVSVNVKHLLDNRRPQLCTSYHVGLHMAQGGSFDCYYIDARNTLKEVLQETEQEANKYNDEKVWQTYCHMIAKTVEKIYAQNKEA